MDTRIDVVQDMQNGIKMEHFGGICAANSLKQQSFFYKGNNTDRKLGNIDMNYSANGNSVKQNNQEGISLYISQ